MPGKHASDPPASAWSASLRSIERSRFALLLLSLLALLVIQPMLPSTPAGSPAVHLDVALSLVLLTCLWSVSRSKAMLSAGAALVGVSLVAITLAHGYDSAAFTLLALGGTLAFLLFATGTLLHHVVRQEFVSTDTVVGASCVYVLIGIVFALVLSILERVWPGSFTTESGAPLAVSGPSGLLVGDFLDYSLFVLTTLGPQVIVPATRVARAWTLLESIIAQLFVAVLIAWLVGQYTAHRSDAK